MLKTCFDADQLVILQIKLAQYKICLQSIIQV